MLHSWITPRAGTRALVLFASALLAVGESSAHAEFFEPPRLLPPIIERNPDIVLAQAQLPPANENEMTAPPVVVRPGMQPTVPGPYYGNTYNGQYNPEGGISWSSDAIATDATLVGPYNQPAWTTQRPFANSRVYVLPPGQMQVEQWVRPTWKEGEKSEFRFLEEYALGLPGRFQLDIYERWNVEPNGLNKEEPNHEGVQIEVRWALANWGVIPLNPTLYAEWVERGGPQDKPNKYELKLLLADEVLPNWFYASNLILEQEVRDERETELAWSHALSTPIIERKLMAGVECRGASLTTQGSRNDPSWEFLIGPSLQWRPTNRTFLDVVGMWGTTKDSPLGQAYFIFGYQFGNRAGPSQGISGPASTRGN